MGDEPKRVVGRPFQPGQGGRPKGARNKLGEAFVAALADHFAQNGANAIQRVWQERPQDYLKVIGNVVPKELQGADGAPLFEGITVQFVKGGK